jgi:hypothetical protein
VGLLPLRRGSALRDAFPTLPGEASSQFNRLVRSHVGLLEAFTSHLAALLGARRKSLYEALDSSAMPTLGTPSAGVVDGQPGVPTSVGVIAWDGRRGSGCSPPSTPPGSSRALASVPLPPLSRAGGRNLLRPKSPAKPQTPERGLGLRATLRGLLKGLEGADNHLRWLGCYGAQLSSARPKATPARCGPSV